MMKVFKDIITSFLISFPFVYIQNYFETTFITDFLKNNLIVILIALLAINSTTQSLILTKIRELIDKLPEEDRSKQFHNTRKQMNNSIIEHIVLICVSMVIFILVDSPKFQKTGPFFLLLQSGVISCFIYSLLNLYDNVKGVFIILDFDPKSKKNY